MTARRRALFWLIANGIWVLLMIGLVVYTFTSKAGAQSSNIVVVPAEMREFCTTWSYPGPIGSMVCFHRDDDGQLRMKCASDEISAAMFRVPLCSEVWNAESR